MNLYAIMIGDKYFSNFAWEKALKLSKNPNFFPNIKQANEVVERIRSTVAEGLSNARAQLIERQQTLARIQEDLVSVDRELAVLEQKPYAEVCEQVPIKVTQFNELGQRLRLYEDLIKDSERTVARCEKLVALKPQIMVFPNRPLSTEDAFDILQA